MRVSAGTLAAVGRLILRPMSLEDCTALVRHRMATREARFLDLVSRHVYANPRSPYLALLRHAGCEEGDLRALVRDCGLEPALERLRDAGVYLSFEEFKGRTEVRRNGKTFVFREADFDTAGQVAGFEVRTSGTRSAGSAVTVGFDHLAGHRAAAYRLGLEALHTGDLPIVLWLFSRRATGLMWWLAMAHIGRPPVHWFYMAPPAYDGITPGHRMLFRWSQTVALLTGRRLPYPAHAPLEQPGRVLDAVVRAQARYGGCVVRTTSSAAARLTALAAERRRRLDGVTFIVGAEPLTPGKAEEIRAQGARVGAQYAFSEAGVVAVPCGRPEVPDDMHLLEDGFAMIQRRRAAPGGGELDAFMFTTLLPTASKIMLNVESDDFGDATRRRCGCLLDDLGLHRHLSTVRSFTKLTGEGMTVLGTDVVHILEEVLPREFGGRSIDYQLLEAEDEQHLTRLHLLVSPAVGAVDEARLRARFLEELRRRPGHAILWRQAESLRVVRREPVATRGGKLLPFHTLAWDQAALAAGAPALPGARATAREPRAAGDPPERIEVSGTPGS